MSKIEIKLKGQENIIRKYGNIVVGIQVFSEDRNLYYEIAGLESIIGYDLEITLSIAPEEVDRLLPEIIYNIIEKKIKLVNELITSELTGAPVLVQIREPKIDLGDNKPVARLIFSDENFLLPYDEDCHEGFKTQIN